VGRVVRGVGFATWVLQVACLGDSVPDATDEVPVLPDVVAVAEGRLFRGALSADGLEFYYFVKVAAGEEDYRVYQTRRTNSGWSEPTMLPLGDSSASSMYPAVSPDGELLVFTSSRSLGGEGGEPGKANLWAARRSDSGWSDPFLLADASTPENYDAAPWFGPGGRLHFTSTSPDWRESWMRTAPRTSESFGQWTDDPTWAEMDWPRSTHHFWSGVLNGAGTLAVLELSARLADGSLDNADLWVVRRGPMGWTEAEPLGRDVNTEGVENFPTFAPDDTTLVFVRDFTAFRSVTLRR